MWSKLKKDLFKVLDPKLLDIQCAVYEKESYGGHKKRRPSYSFFYKKDKIASYPSDTDYRVKNTYYSYGFEQIGDLLREYINTPKKDLLKKRFELDEAYKIVDILIACDTRIGKRKALEAYTAVHVLAAKKILNDRFNLRKHPENSRCILSTMPNFKYQFRGVYSKAMEDIGNDILLEVVCRDSYIYEKDGVRQINHAPSTLGYTLEKGKCVMNHKAYVLEEAFKDLDGSCTVSGPNDEEAHYKRKLKEDISEFKEEIYTCKPANGRKFKTLWKDNKLYFVDKEGNEYKILHSDMFIEIIK